MIHYLKQKGWTNAQIAEFVGHHRDTITRVLREPVDQRPAPRPRRPLAAEFAPQIQRWLDDGLSVQRMLELARADPDHPFQGSDVAFYHFVRPLRRARQVLPSQVAVRFEGLPGELLQIDWGGNDRRERGRQMRFGKPALAGQTRYFFAARLKYSRWMWVRFTQDMRSETLLRCLIACMVDLGGAPWVVTSEPSEDHHLGARCPAAADPAPGLPATGDRVRLPSFAMHPGGRQPEDAQRAPAVENLVKFVKANFVAGREFYDDADVQGECATWLRRVNDERPSDATGELPMVLLEEERPHLKPLPQTAWDYGIFDSVMVSRESLVTIDTNRYSVPVSCLGQALTARIHPERIALHYGGTLVASHPRCHRRHMRVVVPEHYEPVFALKPRARTVVYRDWLMGLGSGVAAYVQRLCRRRYQEMEQQIADVYALAREVGSERFQALAERALEQETIGAEYLRAALLPPAPTPAALVSAALPAGLGPPQREVERDLAAYEAYVANGAGACSVLAASGAER